MNVKIRLGVAALSREHAHIEPAARRCLTTRRPSVPVPPVTRMEDVMTCLHSSSFGVAHVGLTTACHIGRVPRVNALTPPDEEM